MRLIGGLIGVMLFVATAAAAAEDPQIADFNRRVEQYVKVRDAARQKAPHLAKNATAEQIEASERALVKEIQAARANAKQGDVFSPEVQPIFIKILKDNLSGPANKGSRTTAKIGNPEYDKDKGEASPPIKVNGVYPKNAPLSSVPPLLLLQLPKLPKDIEYRFSGQTLLLWDNVSNIIIDYVKGAVPGV